MNLKDYGYLLILIGLILSIIINIITNSMIGLLAYVPWGIYRLWYHYNYKTFNSKEE